MCRGTLGTQTQRDRAWPGPGGCDCWGAQGLGGLRGLYLGWGMHARTLTCLSERESRRGTPACPAVVRGPGYSDTWNTVSPFCARAKPLHLPWPRPPRILPALKPSAPLPHVVEDPQCPSCFTSARPQGGKAETLLTDPMGPGTQPSAEPSQVFCAVGKKWPRAKPCGPSVEKSFVLADAFECTRSQTAV